MLYIINIHIGIQNLQDIRYYYYLISEQMFPKGSFLNLWWREERRGNKWGDKWRNRGKETMKRDSKTNVTEIKADFAAAIETFLD